MVETARSVKETFTGQVKANGTLNIKIGPRYNQTWEVEQVSMEMDTAPSGARANIRNTMGTLISPSHSARRASASGSMNLLPGETITAEWSGVTPGDVGRVLVVYNRGTI